MRPQILRGHMNQPTLDSRQVATLWDYKRTVSRIVRGKPSSLLVMPIGLAPYDSQECVHIRLTRPVVCQGLEPAAALIIKDRTRSQPRHDKGRYSRQRTLNTLLR
jgi:hypothetical protein